MKKFATAAVAAACLTFAAPALADCDDGEMVIKFSHVVAGSGHPKGDAATLLAARWRADVRGCRFYFLHHPHVRISAQVMAHWARLRSR